MNKTMGFFLITPQICLAVSKRPSWFRFSCGWIPPGLSRASRFAALTVITPHPVTARRGSASPGPSTSSRARQGVGSQGKQAFRWSSVLNVIADT